MWWWCGRGRSLRSIVVEEGEVGSTLDRSSLKKSKKKKKKAAKENPYSSLGLDKFSSLLSTLEAQRASIEAELEDTSTTTILWFRFTELNDRLPIFKRLNNHTKEAGHREMPLESEPAPSKHAEDNKVNEVRLSEEMEIDKVKAWSWKDWASAYHPFLLLALVLLCLMFSRVFAIHCATMWWYLVPRLRGKDPRRKSRRLIITKKSVIV